MVEGGALALPPCLLAVWFWKAGPVLLPLDDLMAGPWSSYCHTAVIEVGSWDLYVETLMPKAVGPASARGG